MRPALHIQQASAGSGKTYALTKTFIRLLISKKKADGSRKLREGEELNHSLSHILAITFTNKATTEMKERIVGKLAELAAAADGHADIKGIDYLKEFIEEFQTDAKSVGEACRRALRNLLLNYGEFQVSTIDSFFQNILHTFTYETDFNDTFNLEIDSDYIAAMSVDNALDRIVMEGDGNDTETSQLVKLLIEAFSGTTKWNLFQRKQTDKSLYDTLIKNAKHLDKEEYKEIRESLDDYFKHSGITISDLYESLKEEYEKPVRKAFEKMRQSYGELVTGLKEHGVDSGDWNPNIPNYQEKLGDDNIFGTKTLSVRPPKGLGACLHGDLRKKKSVIKTYTFLEELDGKFRELGEANSEWREALESQEYKTWLEYKKTLPYLGLLHKVEQQKKDYLKFSNTIQLSDTNQLLHKIISEEETPYIYERMGTRINHYLIDEFQDTSMMQWSNLRPLLSESLGQGHDNLVIGDAKQSIYRFRNADHTLISQKLPSEFQHDWSADPIDGNTANKETLMKRINTNWRSALRVIEFNNFFFRHLSQFGKEEGAPLFTQEIQAIYNNCVQPASPIAKEQQRGYVEVNLYVGKKTSKTEQDRDGDNGGKGYDELGDLINELHSRGYRYDEIGILVREKKHGIKAVEAITEFNKRNPKNEIPFISDQSLLVESAISVRLVVMAIESIVKGELPNGNNIPDTMVVDFEKLKETSSTLQSLSLISLTESIIRQIVPEGLRRQETAFLAAFQDAVAEFCESGAGDPGSFLYWWDRKRQSLSIVSPENADAVRIITVHKSKGLEYRCVIIPEAKFYFQPSAKHSDWLWVRPAIGPEEKMPPYIPVESKQSLEKTAHASEWEKYKSDVALDGLNTAYVAFTRAIDELYVYAKQQSGSLSSIGKALAEICEKGLDESQPGENGDNQLLTLPIIKEEIKEENDDPEAASSETAIPDLRFTYGNKLSPKEIADRGRKSENNAKPIIISDYDTTDGHVSLRFVDPDLKRGMAMQSEDEIAADTPRGADRQEGTLKHSIMSMVRHEEDLERAILRHKIKGKITSGQARQWLPELKQAIESVRDYGWFGERFKVINERPFLTAGQKDSRPDRLMTDEGGSLVIVDYKFGSHTGVEEYRSQMRRYMQTAVETGLYESVEGYLWYVHKGEVEKVEPAD